MLGRAMARELERRAVSFEATDRELDIAEAAAWSPPLTTVATDPRRIGEEAAKLLIRRIADPYGSSERVVLPPRLVLSQSCGQGSVQGSGRSGTT